MHKLEIEHKEEYWEFLRGISIIFVVLSHCCVPNVIMNGQLKLSAISLWYCLEVNLISTAVSIFFFISGYWGIKSFLRTKIKKEYYKKRLKRLLIPYVLYSILYILFRMLLMESFTYSKVMMILLLGKACTPLYYIPVLLMFSLLLPYFLNLEKRNALILFSCFLALVCLGFTYWRYATGHKAVWFYLRYTPVWLPFYAIGIKMAYHEHEKNPLLVNRKYEKILILCVIMFLFIKFITMLLLGQNERMSGIIFSQLRFSSLIYSASLILFLIYLKEKELHFPKIFLLIGNYSFGIFFIHMFFVIPFGILYSHYGKTIPILMARYFQFAVSMFGSVLICIAIKMIMKRRLSWILGI